MTKRVALYLRVSTKNGQTPATIPPRAICETRICPENAWHDRFIAALPRAASVLDLGCGSGFPVAQHMAERGLQVTGVDSSPTLISLCRQCLPDHEWLVGDMRSLQLPLQFDGIVAWDSFFHLKPDDQRLRKARQAVDRLDVQ